MNTWRDAYQTPKYSRWLQANVKDLDDNVKKMLDLIEADADSFAQRAEMYYKKRPELMNLVEEFYRFYRTLGERFDQLIGEVRTLPKSVQAQYGVSSASPRGGSRSFGRRRDQQGFEKLLQKFSSGKNFDLISHDLGVIHVDNNSVNASKDEKSTGDDGGKSSESDSDVDVLLQGIKEENQKLTEECSERIAENNKLRESLELMQAKLSLAHKEKLCVLENLESHLMRDLSNHEKEGGEEKTVAKKKEGNDENESEKKEDNDENESEKKEDNDENESEKKEGNENELEETNVKLMKLASSRAYRLKGMEEEMGDLKAENESVKLELSQCRKQVNELKKDIEASKTRDKYQKWEALSISKRGKALEEEVGRLKAEIQGLRDRLSTDSLRNNSTAGNFSTILHEKKRQMKIPDLEVPGNNEEHSIIPEEPMLEAQAQSSLIASLEEENKRLKTQMVDLRKEQERRVNSLNKKVKDLHRQLEFVGEENRNQKVALLERAEEKREAIRQLCFSIDMLMAKNNRLQTAIRSARAKIQQLLINHNHNHNHAPPPPPPPPTK